MTNSDEMFIRRVSFMNGINGSHSHRIDFKNVDEGNMGTFLSRVLGYDYQYEKITEKQFFSYQKKLIDSIQKYQILI